ncbi:MAG: epoxyqueuosine reductase QueH [Candidatus Omnitrophica bacterium]|nr:epoxyqueuosine reductase QueH [Candidatus Omnitrophota bacterium]MBU1869875.1 epoxyqueuosine reductase QueH [Candidatus Omnitrophota bacterium]
MKLLLHVCCAPCLIYPLEVLRSKGFEVVGLFYNPNIHPVAEYKTRRIAVENYSRQLGLEFSYPDYEPHDFFRAVNMKEEKLKRCSICWLQRLAMTARLAREMGFTHFSTTLLVSPYQDQGLLKKIGEDTAKAEGVVFFYEDFRPGFREAHNQARSKGIYCQKYCGCIYSELEAGRK